MDRRESNRARLQEHLDAHGDLAPPWERFPDYEHHTIGWRMGHGETWLGMWSVFLDQLAPDLETRIAYLRRHAPAPFTWADSVHRVLHPEDNEEDDDDSDDDDSTVATERRAALLSQGLIASDVAFTTWIAQQEGVRWPWERHETPEDAARYDTRELWFWSRQIATLRSAKDWTMSPAPEAWQSCVRAVESGDAGPIDPVQGLLSLALMLSAGEVTAPWQLGLSPADFVDSFEMDMSYADAFRLWGMSAFDDAPQLRRYLDTTRVPPVWEPWIAEHFPLD